MHRVETLYGQIYINREPTSAAMQMLPFVIHVTVFSTLTKKCPLKLKKMVC